MVVVLAVRVVVGWRRSMCGGGDGVPGVADCVTESAKLPNPSCVAWV